MTLRIETVHLLAVNGRPNEKKEKTQTKILREENRNRLCSLPCYEIIARPSHIYYPIDCSFPVTESECVCVNVSVSVCV